MSSPTRAILSSNSTQTCSTEVHISVDIVSVFSVFLYVTSVKGHCSSFSEFKLLFPSSSLREIGLSRRPPPFFSSTHLSCSTGLIAVVCILFVPSHALSHDTGADPPFFSVHPSIVLSYRSHDTGTDSLFFSFAVNVPSPSSNLATSFRPRLHFWRRHLVSSPSI